jgi:hypothetical protein
MRRLAPYAFHLSLFLIIGFLISCKEETEAVNRPLLTEGEKAFIPNQPGDTLYFKDETGKNFFLVCKEKALAPVSYVLSGHSAPVGETKWDKLTAHFEGNILNDYDQNLSLETRIEGGDNPTDPNIARPCSSDHKCPFYLIFKVPQNPKKGTFDQIYLGKTDENFYPVIVYFNFIPEITLNGQQFQKLNTASISDNCSSFKPFSFGGFIDSPLGLDSVYYSAQYGLIRLTTVGGKKYQRVL